MGNWGKQPNNMQRQFWGMFDLLFEPLQVPMVLHDPINFTDVESKVGFLLPHMWFYQYYQKNKGLFFERLAGTDADRAGFWGGVSPTDPRRQHPVFGRADLHAKGVPLALHGDGVPCTEGKSLECISMSSLLCTQLSTIDG
eukprot:14755483-Alexandrium_andersonii.AAC.1